MAALSYEERDARILTLKQMGHSLKQIALAVGLGTSRVGQILQQCGGATDKWCCPACGDLVARLGESGWCSACDDNESHAFPVVASPWGGLFGGIPTAFDLSGLG